MGKKCKKCECPAGEKWAVPTADFFSLLLALFIALYAIASVNEAKLAAVKEEFVKIYDFQSSTPEESTPIIQMAPETNDNDSQSKKSGEISLSQEEQKSQNQSDQNPDISIKGEVEDLLKKLESENSILDQTLGGVLLKLPTAIYFKDSTISFIDSDSYIFIKRMAEIIKSLPPYVTISIQGYTDNQSLPLNSPYQDNMELSIKRAQVVMNELVKNGVPSKQLSIAGFASSKPILDNLTEENRAKNRRVEFNIFVSSDTEFPKDKKVNILDSFK